MIHPGSTKNKVTFGMSNAEIEYWDDKFTECQKDALGLFATKYGFYSENIAKAVAFAFLEEQEGSWDLADFLNLNRADMLAIADDFEGYVELLKEDDDRLQRWSREDSAYDNFVNYMDFRGSNE